MKRIVLLLVVIIIVALGIVFAMMKKPAPSAPEKVAQATATPTKTATNKKIAAVYKGTLPCGDCSGLETTLTLYADETYNLTSVYQGKSVKPLVETGMWTTLRGDATDPNATVYQLYHPNNPSENQNYLKVNDTQIKQLDSNLKEISAPPSMNFTLTKQEETK